MAGPQRRHTGRRVVARLARWLIARMPAQANVGKGLKVGLADLQVDDVSALGLQGLRFKRTA